MRNLVLSCALLAVVGCAKNEVPAGALKVEIAANGFAPGCVQVTADDAAGHHASSTLTNVARGSNQVLALEGPWGAELKVTAQAFEQTCGTHLVATQTLPASVPATGVGSLSLALSAPDEDNDGFVAKSAGGSDCNDSISGGSSIHPGATELCNGVDDNCDGQIDEGLNSKTYYRDQDNDGYGRSDVTQVACSSPGAGWVPTAGDCDDTNAFVHPKSGGEEACDGLDDDCNGAIDDSYQVGMACLAANSCTGTFQCVTSTSSDCVAPAYYADLDGDGHGAGGKLASCSVGGGEVTSHDDCDDGDPLTYPGAADVCDQRDNSCSNPSNPDPTCQNAQWAERAVDGGSNPDGGTNGWRTASVDSAGGVWFAGDNDAVIRHTDAGISDLSGSCTGTASGHWKASWVDPSGTVYLGGEETSAAGAGLVSSLGPDGGCSLTSTAATAGIVEGVFGTRSGGQLDLFAVDDSGKIYVNGAATTGPGGTNVLLGIHGVSASEVIAVGEVLSNKQWWPVAYKGGSSGGWISLSAAKATGTGVTVSNGALRAVYMLDSQTAYMVGDGAMVMRWTGSVPTLIAPPSDTTSATSFNSVIAFSRSDVYVVSSDRKIYRLKADDTWDPVLTPTALSQPLNAITGLSRDNLWVAGDNDLTVHWHEP